MLILVTLKLFMFVNTYICHITFTINIGYLVKQAKIALFVAFKLHKCHIFWWKIKLHNWQRVRYDGRPNKTRQWQAKTKIVPLHLSTRMHLKVPALNMCYSITYMCKGVQMSVSSFSIDSYAAGGMFVKLLKIKSLLASINTHFELIS